MSNPLKRHSERINYIRSFFITAAQNVTSVKSLANGRDYIWSDLGEIQNAKVKGEAQAIFRTTMKIAEGIENAMPSAVGPIVVEGMLELIDYLEANDVGDPSDSATA